MKVLAPMDAPDTTSGLNHLGAEDPIAQLQAADRRKQKQADAEQLRSLPSRVGLFLLDHKYWILGGLAAGALVLMNWPADPAKWSFPKFDDDPGKKRRRPPVRSYAALGASSATRESTLRVLKAAREDEKYYIKLAEQAEKLEKTAMQRAKSKKPAKRLIARRA